MPFDEPRRWLVVEAPQQRIRPESLGLRHLQAVLLEGLVVTAELPHETKEANRLGQVQQQRQV